MKKLQTFIFLFFCFTYFLNAEENSTLQVPQSSLLEHMPAIGVEDEIQVLEHLIASTSKQLEAEKQLKDLMVEFRKEQEEFVQGNQTKSHASRMVNTAREIHTLILENHIEHLFPKNYLEEISFFSSIAGKRTITKP